MTLLNTEFLINRNSMKHSIKQLMKEVMVEYFDKELLVEKIEKKTKNDGQYYRKKVEATKTTYFLYLNTSKNVCTYIHKRGKNVGHMCH